jgi:hypothetical protein
MANEIRTRDTRIHNLVCDAPNDVKDNNLRHSSETLAHYLPTDTCKNDPELAAVLSAWPALPEAIKAGIVALIKAASK